MRVQSFRQLLKKSVGELSLQGFGEIRLYYGERNFTILSCGRDVWTFHFYHKGRKINTKTHNDENMLYIIDLCHLDKVVALWYNGEVYKKQFEM